MDIIIKILVLLGGIVGGVLMMRHNYQLVQLFGYAGLAERYLGQGGSYTMWKLLGLLAIFGSLYYVFS
ncbi:MAG: hypothetical protein WD157_00735 [Patescibacteria group bacterium]